MKEQIVSFETAKLLYELGYRLDKENTLNWYTKNGELTDGLQHFFLSNEELDIENIYAAPTQCLAQKWLREQHNAIVEVSIDFDYFTMRRLYHAYVYRITRRGKERHIGLYNNDTYEQALEIGLQEAIKIIKASKNERNKIQGEKEV